MEGQRNSVQSVVAVPVWPVLPFYPSGAGRAGNWNPPDKACLACLAFAGGGLMGKRGVLFSLLLEKRSSLVQVPGPAPSGISSVGLPACSLRWEKRVLRSRCPGTQPRPVSLLLHSPFSIFLQSPPPLLARDGTGREPIVIPRPSCYHGTLPLYSLPQETKAS